MHHITWKKNLPLENCVKEESVEDYDSNAMVHVVGVCVGVCVFFLSFVALLRFCSRSVSAGVETEDLEKERNENVVVSIPVSINEIGIIENPPISLPIGEIGLMEGTPNKLITDESAITGDPPK